MALPKTIERLEDLPEIVRDHYVDKDGVLTLTLMPTEEHQSLITALNDERRLRREADKLHSEMKVKFEGIDPDEVYKLRERVKGLDDADVYDKQGIEALVLRRTESMKADHERVTNQKNQEITALKAQSADFDRRWRQDRIKTALLDAAAKAGVAKGAMPDAVQRGLAMFADLDEQGNVVAKRGEDLIYGKDGISPLSPEEWMTQLKTDAPHLWPPSSGGGAPAYHGANGQAVDWSKITNPAERLTAWRAAQARDQR